MRPTIILLTDFGHTDPYLGQMKGVLLRHAPEVHIVDLCHEITPQCIWQAEFMLRISRMHFPKKSIFIAVVDPGVGTARQLLLAHNENQFFLAPDNGLLSFLLTKATTWWQLSPLPATNSHTFHGRDLLAPLAAQLALGTSPDTLGTPIDATDLIRLNPEPALVTPEQITCRTLHVDRFGNCLLSLPIQNLSASFWRLSTGHRARLVQTYAQLAPQEIGLLAGSQEVMELAMNQSHCARFINVSPGQVLTLTPVLDPDA